MEVLLLLPLALAYFSYSLTRYIAEKYLEEKYNGNYAVHSLISFILSFLIFILLFIASKNNIYQGTHQTYFDYIHGRFSPYLFFVFPAMVTFFIIEFVIRKIIYKNSIVWVCLNTIFLLLIPLIAAWFENGFAIRY